jgi:hypothetical protein
MIGKAVALVTALVFAAQAYAQTNQGTATSTPGVTSGPAAGSATSMRSPQAGPLETKHQQKVVRDQSKAVRSKTSSGAHRSNDETGATGSSSPSYAAPPR